MRLAIIGYGRLGKAVGEVWEKAGGEISAKITSSDEWTAEGLDCDLVFESTTPDEIPFLTRKSTQVSLSLRLSFKTIM